MNTYTIPLHKPFFDSRETKIVQEVLRSGNISGDKNIGVNLRGIIQTLFNARFALPVSSCTSALEMASIVIGLKENDEVIMPSFTMTSTAISVVRQLAKPVFVDIREDTYNIDEDRIELAITNKTKAIYVVHYAGFPCNLDAICKVAKRHNLKVIEDAAHAVGSKYRGKFLGTFGDIGCYSFHETKNIVCGEGGAFLTNDSRYGKRAEVIREKGTNRSAFFRGEVDKYTWVDIGSSYVLSDILGSVVKIQLEKMEEITTRRQVIANAYLKYLRGVDDKITLPIETEDTYPNWHIFAIRVPTEHRDSLIEKLKEKGIQTAFHYVPLHLSPKGKQYGYKKGDLPITEKVSGTLIRLPIYPALSSPEVEYISDSIVYEARKW